MTSQRLRVMDQRVRCDVLESVVGAAQSLQLLEPQPPYGALDELLQLMVALGGVSYALWRSRMPENWLLGRSVRVAE